ncbi:hypothetical protein [Mesorhizobium sp. RMAD-H1]|uniref:hypothetical protein n=1 Tax=Mesorhizobium sp. RMAD-H1 TaxID=2587065 RepID=UPI0016108CD0|nr:hypothetical protein [Mesorhizobium sp. RMAD-H1]MBB2971430.1 hypothetical protein [Mesorhizobium sp. RMAD-H1]
MSVTLSPIGQNPAVQNFSTSKFEENLNIAKSSQILVDYLKGNGKSAINADELSKLASNPGGDAPADVSAAAAYMLRHPDVYTAIETHDVAGADGLSGFWNFEWAAQGGLSGTSIEAVAMMSDAFDRAITKSAQVTEITTDKKAGLDASKQRAQN